MLGKQDRVVLDTLVPARMHESLNDGILDAGFEIFYQRFSRQGNLTWRMGFRASLLVAAWVAPLLIRRMPPLSLHDRPVRERAVAALGSSRLYLLRQLYFVLKSVSAFSYGADPKVRTAIGLPPLDEPKVSSV